MESVNNNHNLIHMEDLDRVAVERLIDCAERQREARVTERALPSFILGLLFFQESTRTQLGFQSAAYRLGGQVLTLKETKFQDSMSVRESIEDTVRVVSAYTDIICIRHSDDDTFLRISSLTQRPVINCGNGFDEHPTQALTDLMAIQKFAGTIDGLSIALVGDLRNMRSAHSLLLGLSKFSDIFVRCISPKQLAMPERYKASFVQTSNTLEESDVLEVSDVDVVYIAGFPPKTPLGSFGTAIRKKYQINGKVLTRLKKNAVVLCPLPRVDEITKEVDQTRFAKYFEQSELGLFMRMAVLVDLLER